MQFAESEHYYGQSGTIFIMSNSCGNASLGPIGGRFVNLFDTFGRCHTIDESTDAEEPTVAYDCHDPERVLDIR